MLGFFIGAALLTVSIFAFCIYLEECTEHENFTVLLLFLGVGSAFVAIICFVLTLNEVAQGDEYMQTWCTSQEGAVYGGGGCFRNGEKLEMPKEVEK